MGSGTSHSSSSSSIPFWIDFQSLSYFSEDLRVLYKEVILVPSSTHYEIEEEYLDSDPA